MKPSPKVIKSFPLERISNAISVSTNPRMPLADISNAPELFGDPFDFGDVEEGDVENSDALAMYQILSGDPEDGDVDFGDFDETGDFDGSLYGGPKRRVRRPLSQGAKIGLASAGSALAGIGTGYGIAAIVNAVKKRNAARRQNAQLVNRAGRRQTLRNQRRFLANSGKIAKNQKMPFLGVIGAKLNASPITVNSAFPADMLKQSLDRQNSDTPFQQETALGTFALGTWTASAVGTVNARFYSPIIVMIGINALAGVPATAFTVTMTLPLINGGSLVISSQPFVYTIDKGFDVKLIVYPWQLVTNMPLLVLGQYDNAHPITVSVTGLPAQAAVTLVVPGSLHPWIIALRNALNP